MMPILVMSSVKIAQAIIATEKVVLMRNLQMKRQAWYLLERDNIIVITEAHRTQYGTLANMRKALPNASS